MEPTTTSAPSPHRLLSLDILRGLDLFLLVALQPVLWDILHHANGGVIHETLRMQLDHAPWTGFRLWDLVMPLFLFMSGVALPYSVARYDRTRRTAFLLRLMRRVVLLWVLGMVVQGNLFAFDLQTLRIYSNTLQAIAAGYLIAALAMMTLSVRGQAALAVGLLVLYAVPMMLRGDWTPEGNFAEAVERAVLGRWRDGVWWDAGGWHFSPHYSYTWVWSSLTFGFTVLSGAMAGHIVRRPTFMPRNARLLLMCGLALTAAGWLWGQYMPIIKRLWTSSMALYSSGLCTLLLALCYYVIDVRGWRRGSGWLKVFGMNSIAAYMLGEWLNLRSVAHQFLYGLEPHVGEWYPILLTTGHVFLVWGILYALYRNKIFLRI